MSWLSSISDLFSGVGNIVGKIFGSKEQREKDSSAEIQLSKQTVIAELQASSNRKDFFTVFVDGLNRLVRPTFSYGVIGFFAWVVIDPVQFTISMQALALVPTFMYGIFLTIIGFWFGGRIVEKYADAKLQFPTNSQLQEVLKNQQAILERTQEKEKEVEDHILTAAAIATPNSVINETVQEYSLRNPTEATVNQENEKEEKTTSEEVYVRSLRYP